MTNELLAFNLVDMLKRCGLTIAVAESCTGGMFSQYITSVDGASNVFGVSIVTYSNEAKQAFLDVSEDTLNNYGAVSSQCAAEMAIGIRLTAFSSIGISITGIAGPTGYTDVKPVGTVYIAISTDELLIQKKVPMCDGNRQKIRENTVSFVMMEIIKMLKERYGG